MYESPQENEVRLQLVGLYSYILYESQNVGDYCKDMHLIANLQPSALSLENF